MNPTILVVIDPGFLNQVPALVRRRLGFGSRIGSHDRQSWQRTSWTSTCRAVGYTNWYTCMSPRMARSRNVIYVYM